MADREMTEEELRTAMVQGWNAPEGSPYRTLTAEEVRQAVAAAQLTTPSFEGEHNAPWELHHPVMRAVWGTPGRKGKEG